LNLIYRFYRLAKIADIIPRQNALSRNDNWKINVLSSCWKDVGNCRDSIIRQTVPDTWHCITEDLVIEQSLLLFAFTAVKITSYRLENNINNMHIYIFTGTC